MNSGSQLSPFRPKSSSKSVSHAPPTLPVIPSAPHRFAVPGFFTPPPVLACASPTVYLTSLIFPFSTPHTGSLFRPQLDDFHRSSRQVDDFAPEPPTLIRLESTLLHNTSPTRRFYPNHPEFPPSGPTPAQQLRIATYSATRRRQSVLRSYTSLLPSVARSNPLANAERAMAPHRHRPLSSHHRPHRVADVYQQPRPFSSSDPLPAPLRQGNILARELTSNSEPHVRPQPLLPNSLNRGDIDRHLPAP